MTGHDDVGAYALGALAPEDARRFERHLEQCEECQVELAQLRPVVAALPAAADPVAPPSELRERIMSVVEAEAAQRREPARASLGRRWLRRPLPVLAAACAVLLAGLGIGIALDGGDGRTYPAQVEMAGASAELVVEDDRGELAVEDMPPPPDGRVYQVWLKRPGEAPAPTDALFTVGRDGDARVAVPGALEGVEAVLVTHEREGGSEIPTRPPLIVAETA